MDAFKMFVILKEKKILLLKLVTNPFFRAQALNHELEIIGINSVTWLHFDQFNKN